jgi:hypothetical protein
VAHVAPDTIDHRAEAGQLAQAVQAATGEGLDLADADQDSAGERDTPASKHGIELQAVKLAATRRRLV